jgi:hypothetical protein
MPSADSDGTQRLRSSNQLADTSPTWTKPLELPVAESTFTPHGRSVRPNGAALTGLRRFAGSERECRKVPRRSLALVAREAHVTPGALRL